jgi:hypothetical protein
MSAILWGVGCFVVGFYLGYLTLALMSMAHAGEASVERAEPIVQRRASGSVHRSGSRVQVATRGRGRHGRLPRFEIRPHRPA